MIDLDVAGIMFPVLLVSAFALIAGGFVVYRKSRILGWRAVAMAAMASGFAMVLFVTFVYPVTTTTTVDQRGPVTTEVPAETSNE